MRIKMSEYIGFKLPRELRERLDRKAEEEDRPLSRIVRRALERELAPVDEEGK